MASTTSRELKALAARRITPAALLALVLLTGCGPSAQEDRNSTVMGDDKSLGALNLRSVLLVTSEEGEPARILGTLVNDSKTPVEVTISDSDEKIALTVPAQGDYPMDTNTTLLDTAEDAPGARTTLTALTAEGSVELLVPVVDGTLDPYQPYLPD